MNRKGVFAIKKKWNYLSDKTPRNQGEDLISYILRLRGIKDADRFLNPRKEDMLPLEDLQNIDKAANIIVKGIENYKTFCVHFDVDVDGISAGTTIYKTLKSFDVNVKWMINNRKIHGISHKNIEDFKDIDILVIVDSLDNDYKIYDELKSNGVEIVILDHHEFKKYPESATLVSSAKNYSNPALSGAGVVWKFCSYLDKLTHSTMSENLIDLAACGILGDVCDVSENSPENRYICYKGISNLQNVGLKAIIDTYEFNSKSILWSIAPLVNAAQRMNMNTLAVELFLSEDKKEARKIVKKLKEIKAKQDELVTEVASKLDLHIQKQDYDKNKVVFGFVDINEFAGLIATKMADKYKKPAIVFHQPTDDTQELTGSIRGFGVKDFSKVINSTGLAKCYGHENAAGIRCPRDNFSKLITSVNDKLKDVEFELVENIDVKINLQNISYMFIETLSRINMISGKGFKAVSVAIEEVELRSPTILADKHTKLCGGDLYFIKWNDLELYDLFDYENGYYKVIDVLGELQINSFRGERMKQFIISDYQNFCIYPEFLRKH